MPILHIEHGIRDFDTWKGLSTAHPAGDSSRACAATESSNPPTIRTTS